MHDLIEKFSVMCYWKPLLCQPLHILRAAACNFCTSAEKASLYASKNPLNETQQWFL